MNSKGFDRRDFLKMVSVGLAGGYVVLKTGNSQAQMHSGGGGVIDPPPGALFQDPVLMPLIRSGNVVDVNLEAKVAPVNINGTVANLMTYNGYYPGPTISVKSGDILRVNFINSLPATTKTNALGYQKNITNIHPHGWHVSPQKPADFALLEIFPGQTYQYQFDTALQEGGTLNFYHPHKHGLVAEQVWGGLAGALVVEDETPVLSEYETHILVLKDISLSNSAPAAFSSMDFQSGKEGNIIMVNGQVNPVLSLKQGEVQRWRILNASNARFYKLGFANNQGAVMYLAGTESGLLDKPYARSQILLSPGERVDILVQAGATAGSYKFLSLPYARTGTTTSAQITLGAYEVWTVNNRTNMDHPFHQHVNAAQVLSITGADASYPPYAALPAWKDTVLVPKNGSVTLLVPVEDYIGTTVFHCHILEHEDIGMMGVWQIN